MKKLRHVVIDLETLDRIPSSKIVSIGAVICDPRYGRISKDIFYVELDHKNQIHRTTCPDTVKWWKKQSPQVRAALKGTTRMKSALEDLAFWVPDDCKVWGNGATFDISMLEDAYRQHDLEIPWKFWNIRDLRTIRDMYESKRGGLGGSPAGGNHNALEDAKLEAKLLLKMWHSILGGD